MNNRGNKLKRLFAWLGLMIALAAGLGWLGWYALRRTNLLVVATRVADVSKAHRYTDWGDFYWWISPREVVLERGRADEPQSHRFLRKNLETGAEHELTELIRQFTATHGTPYQMYESPDGKWLLWGGVGKDDSLQDCWGAQIDGSHPIHWVSGLTDVLWLPDSQSWAEFIRTSDGENFTKVRIRSVQAPASSIQFPISTQSPSEAMSVLRFGKLMAGNHLLIEDYWNPGNPDLHRVGFLDLDLNTGCKVSRKFSVSLPENVGVEGNNYSLNGDRIAWVLCTPQRKGLDVWLHRLLPYWVVKEKYVLGVWVSQLDGTKMHEIGHIPIQNPYTSLSMEWFSDLRWLPDGHHLSFVYNDVLYRVPVD